MRIDTANGVIRDRQHSVGSRHRAYAHFDRSTLPVRQLRLAIHSGIDVLNGSATISTNPPRKAALAFRLHVRRGLSGNIWSPAGKNRDTAWFAMIDADWPRLKAGYDAAAAGQFRREQAAESRFVSTELADFAGVFA